MATEQPQELPTLASLLLRHWPPAKHAVDDVLMLSTSKLWELVNGHAPGAFAETELYLTLVQQGYVTKQVGQEPRWLIQRIA